MKFKQAGWAVALAAAVSASAFAQAPQQTPQAPAQPVGEVTVVEGAAVTSTSPVMIRGSGLVQGPDGQLVANKAVYGSSASIVQAGESRTVDGNTVTVTRNYWVNVPPNVMRDGDFQRWQHLR